MRAANREDRLRSYNFKEACSRPTESPIPMRVSYTPGYFIRLPDNHPFPMGKFPGFHRILLAEGLISVEDVQAPEPASWELLESVHTAAYLGRLRSGTLGREAERKMGLPWSPYLVRRSRLAVQGTLNAATMALEDGVAANLAGGTHHAFSGHGEGFCVLNDVAVTVLSLTRAGKIGRSLIVDLDVHQGNGTAAILSDEKSAFTFSIHGANNYPFRKSASDLDVPLPDGTGDDEYLQALLAHLPQLLERARPDIVLYLAGVDVMAGDRYGRLSLTREGLHRRDNLVLKLVRERDTPLVLLMSGGYAPTPTGTADLHAVVHREARRLFG